MKKESNPPYIFNSISELHRALGLPKPLHPLISLVDYGHIKGDTTDISKGMIFNFYKVSYKKNFTGKIKYGQGHYDFDEGGLSFVSPNQVITAGNDEADYSGYTLLFHPDFIRDYPLARNIRNYGFFSYSVSEALYLSEREKDVIIGIFKNIALELDSAIDSISQDVLVSQLELLLNYSRRFYTRQFITRKAVNNDLLASLEGLLSAYFDTDKGLESGLPTVQHLADALNVTPHYLSDMLRALTGQNGQQHIHNKLMERAKYLLSTTHLTIAEIAYQLGFEHPQSFTKIFRRKAKMSPLEFRKTFN
ncbi:MAG TPA: helix-turn-helix transcriptional regulator [Puia sp.]|nr:helix-turn-helix transcriptional regulator [Puia sp.]